MLLSEAKRKNTSEELISLMKVFKLYTTNIIKNVSSSTSHKKTLKLCNRETTEF